MLPKRALISHPPEGSRGAILLCDHLQDVGRRAAGLLGDLKEFLKLQIPAEDLVRAAFIVGITHDFGKAKQQCQDYLHGNPNVKDKDKEHAALSSIFTFLVAQDWFAGKDHPTCRLPFVCAYAVNRHHARLRNITEAFQEVEIEDQLYVARGRMDERVWKFAFKEDSLGLEVSFSKYQEDFEKADARSIAGQFGEFALCLEEALDGREEWPLDVYFALLLIVSALAEADVASVLGLGGEDRPRARPLDPECICRYAAERPQGGDDFQKLRKRAWAEIQERLPQAGAGACRLTLPTGLGKTLMGLYVAAKLQDRTPRPIVYALPYLSIIEQAADVARQALGGKSRVLRHHSLSLPGCRWREDKASADDEASADFERARFAMEDWDADLVVTTFDQLLYSFLTPDRGFIRRFFRLPGSVVLLDEVQVIPARLLPAVEEFLHGLQRKLGVRLVYITATRPPFLREIPRLVDREEDYFKPLRRTRLRLNLDPMPFSRYLEELPAWLRDRKGKKVLLVANTIRCAQRLFDHLARLRQGREFRDLHLFLLSGGVIPVRRLRRIHEIQRLTQNEPDAWVCVVSTQCVEAGVDLDMDEAVRDLGPWDSLMQICGRVNRSSRKPPSDVWVYQWIDDEGNRERAFYSYIYDSLFMDATLNVLKDRQIVEEEEYWEVQQRYAEELERRLSRESADKVIRKALAWEFDELEFRDSFRDQQNAWKVPVFCVADETAERLKEIAVRLRSDGNPEEARRLLEGLCDSEDLFRPLREFLHMGPDEVKGQVRSLSGQSGRRLRFNLARLLGPMLQAYTISVPKSELEVPKSELKELGIRSEGGFMWMDSSEYERRDPERTQYRPPQYTGD